MFAVLAYSPKVPRRTLVLVLLPSWDSGTPHICTLQFNLYENQWKSSLKVKQQHLEI